MLFLQFLTSRGRESYSTHTFCIWFLFLSVLDLCDTAQNINTLFLIAVWRLVIWMYLFSCGWTYILMVSIFFSFAILNEFVVNIHDFLWTWTHFSWHIPRSWNFWVTAKGHMQFLAQIIKSFPKLLPLIYASPGNVCKRPCLQFLFLDTVSLFYLWQRVLGTGIR